MNEHRLAPWQMKIQHTVEFVEDLEYKSVRRLVRQMESLFEENHVVLQTGAGHGLRVFNADEAYHCREPLQLESVEVPSRLVWAGSSKQQTGLNRVGKLIHPFLEGERRAIVEGLESRDFFTVRTLPEFRELSKSVEKREGRDEFHYRMMMTDIQVKGSRMEREAGVLFRSDLILTRSSGSGVHVEETQLTLSSEYGPRGACVEQRDRLRWEMARQRKRDLDNSVQQSLLNGDAMMCGDSVSKRQQHLAGLAHAHLRKLGDLQSPFQRLDLESRKVTSERGANQPRV
jgi:hypothetical protein